MKYLIVFIVVGLSIGCSHKKNEKIQQESKSNPNLTQPTFDNKKVLEEEAKVDIKTGYKIGYHDNEKKYKFYYKEIVKGDNVIKQFRDVFKSDSLLINGILKFESSKYAMIENYGQPDSIKAFYNELEDSKGEVIYYRDVKLIMNSYDSIVRMENIEFKDSSTFVQYGDLKLDASTNISKFEELFPLSFINAEFKKNPKGDNTIKETIWLRFSTNDGYTTEDQFIFSFHDGKLNNIWYWYPM